MSEQSLVPEGEGGEENESSWLWTEGVAGEGDKPEWLQEKYTSVDAQAQAYVELQSRFGSWSGAPEGDEGLHGYSTENFIPENLKAEGVELDLENDPFITQFVPEFKALNLGQAGLDQLAQKYVAFQADQQQQAQVTFDAEMAKLGSNVEKRIGNIADYLRANECKALPECLTSAAAVMEMEKLIAKNKGVALSRETPPVPEVTKAEVEALQMAVDDNGNRKMNDPDYAKMVREKLAKLVGDGPDNQIIG